MDSEKNDSIDEIRRFNRHYAPAMRLLEQHYLQTDYVTMEADVLLELAEGPGQSARDLVARFGTDKGYLSRILQRFEDEGLIERTPSPTDGRVKLLSLTETGERRARELVEMGRNVVRNTLSGATDEEIDEIAGCMRTITRIMSEARTRAEQAKR